MGFRLVSGNDLVPHLFWKRNINQPILVHVPKLSLAESELKPPHIGAEGFPHLATPP